jgi:hypothetical protein
MASIYEKIALVYFALATIALMLFSFALFVIAVTSGAGALLTADPVDDILDSIGLLVIGFALVETSKFIVEEELLRRRELRSSAESRRALTKFITIIVIVASLEALVMMFKASRTDIYTAIYPAMIFIAATFALTALGAYQWLSSRIAQGSEDA